NGAMSAVFANQNINIGSLWGMHAGFDMKINDHLNFTGNINFTNGRLETASKEKIPMDHIPPLFGKASLNYINQGLNLDLYTLFNGWKRIEDYNPSGEDNAQYATPDGTPAWFTINFKAGYHLDKWILQAGLENILDRNYRLFASGF